MATSLLVPFQGTGLLVFIVNVILYDELFHLAAQFFQSYV